MAIVTRVAQLHAEKEAQERKRISLTKAAAGSGMTRQAYASWYTNSVKVYYPEMIEGLCKYFECTICELLAIVPDGEEAEQGQPEAAV